MPERDSILDLLAGVLAGEERSFAEVCRRHGLRPAQALARIVDDGPVTAKERGANADIAQASPMERYRGLQRAAQLVLDAELTGARFRAVRTINDLANPEQIEFEASPARMRSLEMARRACISLMRLHLPACNMAPPRKAPAADRREQTQSPPEVPTPITPAGNYVDDINTIIAKHEARIKSNTDLRSFLRPSMGRVSSTEPRPEQLIPSWRLMDEPRSSAKKQTPEREERQPASSRDTSTESIAPDRNRFTTPAEAPIIDSRRSTGSAKGQLPARAVSARLGYVRKKIVSDLIERDVPRATIARALRHLRADERSLRTPGHVHATRTEARPP